jgi:hypothetical protein
MAGVEVWAEIRSAGWNLEFLRGLGKSVRALVPLGASAWGSAPLRASFALNQLQVAQDAFSPGHALWINAGFCLEVHSWRPADGCAAALSISRAKRQPTKESADSVTIPTSIQQAITKYLDLQ